MTSELANVLGWLLAIFLVVIMATILTSVAYWLVDKVISKRMRASELIVDPDFDLIEPIHFRLVGRNHPVCGHVERLHSATILPDQVTCGCCKKTEAYREMANWSDTK